MSFDLRFVQLCPHRIIDEELAVDDNGYYPIPYPLSSTAEIKVDGNKVPPQGLNTYAKYISTASLPISITRLSYVSIGIDGAPPAQVAIQPGLYDINSLRSALAAINIGLSKNGNELTFWSNSSGSGSVIVFGTPSSTSAHTELGIPESRVFYGKNKFPSWSLIPSPATLDPEYKCVVFSDALSWFSNSPVVEVSYNTRAQFCRRCFGLRLENDWRYDGNGELAIVVNEELLLQEVRKIIFTIIGSNPRHRWYGTKIMDMISEKGVGAPELQIASDIATAIHRWQSIKKQQQRVQTVSNGEYPHLIKVVDARMDASDPTIIRISVEIMSRSRVPVSLETSFVTRTLNTPLLTGS